MYVSRQGRRFDTRLPHPIAAVAATPYTGPTPPVPKLPGPGTTKTLGGVRGPGILPLLPGTITARPLLALSLPSRSQHSQSPLLFSPAKRRSKQLCSSHSIRSGTFIVLASLHAAHRGGLRLRSGGLSSLDAFRCPNSSNTFSSTFFFSAILFAWVQSVGTNLRFALTPLF